MLYEAEYEDDNIEVFRADNDSQAQKEAWNYENTHGTLFNIYELNEEYNCIRTIL